MWTNNTTTASHTVLMTLNLAMMKIVYCQFKAQFHHLFFATCFQIDLFYLPCTIFFLLLSNCNEATFSAVHAALSMEKRIPNPFWIQPGWRLVALCRWDKRCKDNFTPTRDTIMEQGTASGIMSEINNPHCLGRNVFINLLFGAAFFRLKCEA